MEGRATAQVYVTNLAPMTDPNKVSLRYNHKKLNETFFASFIESVYFLYESLMICLMH